MRKGWTYKKFEECLVKVPKTKQVQTSEYNSGTKYPIVSQEDKLVSGFCDDSSLLFHIDGPVVIFGDHTRALKYVDFDFVVGADGVKILIPKEFLKAKLLYYYLLWYNVPSLGYSRHYKLLKEIRIPLPPLPVQQSIVSELDKINELINLKKAQLSDLDNLAQSIFYEMFGDPVENEKGWEVKKLGNSFAIGAGGTPNKSVKEYWDNGTIPWIGSNMCQNCIITETDGRYITEEGLTHSSAKILDVNTVLVALVGATIGKVALLKTRTSTNQNVAFIKVNESKEFVSEYVFFHLMNQHQEFMMIGNGDFKMANQTFIKSLPIMLPPLPLQQAFAKRIELIERQKAAITSAIKDLETLLASRMQYWFD